MEYYWTLFNNSNGSGTSTTSAHLPAPHNRNFGHAWDLPTTSQHNNSQLFCNPDPHLTCLKLGKRHYFEDLTPPPPPPPVFSIAKRGKSCVAAAEAAVPRCQVEGCEAVLVNAKDYHRRHKVCEMHAKAPKVVVLGMEQRFCQQCSRFHGLAEFDEAKRSCRRRLAGHNERRRKSSQEHNSLARRNHQGGQVVQGQFVNNGECALSLLSPNYPWTTSSSPDLPARCSAALRELIAENRASLMGCRQLINPNNFPESRGHVTLNLMQAQESAFALLSPHTNNNNNNNRSSQDDAADADCSDLWKLPLGY